jgi:hypothetical protein
LPGSSLDKVVQAANNYKSICLRIDNRINKAKVSTLDMLGMRRLGRYLNEGGMLVELPVYLA